MKYRKKPVVVEATQWFKGGDHPKVQPLEHGPWNFDLDEPCGTCKQDREIHGELRVLDSVFLWVCPGDWIIECSIGELHLCKPDVFEHTYELAEEAIE